jgi:hypothetical protein
MTETHQGTISVEARVLRQQHVKRSVPQPQPSMMLGGKI